MLRKLWLPLLLATVSLASAQESRHFTFHYGFTVKNVPAGEKVRIWIPAAHSDEFQEVKVISASGDLGSEEDSRVAIRKRNVLRRGLQGEARPTCTLKSSMTWFATSV